MTSANLISVAFTEFSICSKHRIEHSPEFISGTEDVNGVTTSVVVAAVKYVVTGVDDINGVEVVAARVVAVVVLVVGFVVAVVAFVVIVVGVAVVVVGFVVVVVRVVVVVGATYEGQLFARRVFKLGIPRKVRAA